MRPRAFRRIVLAPAEPLSEEAAEAAAVALAERPPDGILRLGSVAAAGTDRLLVTSAEPAGAGRIGAETEVRLDLRPLPASAHDVWDVAVVLDHGAGMRSHLPAARAGVERFLANAQDTVRHAALLGAAQEPFRVLPLKPLQEARITLYSGLQARGHGALVEGVDLAFAELLQGDPRTRRACIVVASGEGARPADSSLLVDAGLRARRLGITLHAWEAGAADTPGLEDAAKAAGGLLSRGSAGLRPALEALSREAGVPLTWKEAPPLDEEVEFEIVVRAIPPDPPGFPKIPRKRRKP